MISSRTEDIDCHHQLIRGPLAPSSVPWVKAPFNMNFMLPVPLASFSKNNSGNIYMLEIKYWEHVLRYSSQSLPIVKCGLMDRGNYLEDKVKIKWMTSCAIVYCSHHRKESSQWGCWRYFAVVLVNDVESVHLLTLVLVRRLFECQKIEFSLMSTLYFLEEVFEAELLLTWLTLTI